eukprot:TRINITY_DN10578_c0_g1_i1.p1 TRINITY_DN10578_c0_g1~~TRINITY_DN10578_c0_g1_i1.p1  ORF type:complete len:102 (+),score=1.38 TRINITY_DN10578_c0_g1_i1:62-367(+)
MITTLAPIFLLVFALSSHSTVAHKPIDVSRKFPPAITSLRYAVQFYMQGTHLRHRSSLFFEIRVSSSSSPSIDSKNLEKTHSISEISIRVSSSPLMDSQKK